MRHTPALRRTLAVAVTALVLGTASSDVVGSAEPAALAQSQGNGLAGTWFVKLPGGLTGFYTYHQDGTMTGAVSTMFGALPQPPGPLSTNSPDHGVWRQTGGGFLVVIYRFLYKLGSDPVGDPSAILRIRMALTLDEGRESATGEWLVDLWFCQDAFSCPDPNTTPPNLWDISPGPGLNTLTQTRVRIE